MWLFPFHCSLALLLALGSTLFSNPSGGAFQQSVYDFSYQTQDRWQENWPLCSSGRRQSPIDINETGDYEKAEVKLSFENVAQPLMIQPNGSMRIPFGYAQLAVTLPGAAETAYQSTGISFKAPGEHSVGGRRGAIQLEVRFRRIEGNGDPLAVLAIRVLPVDNPAVDFLSDELGITQGNFFQSRRINLNRAVSNVKNGKMFVYRGSFSRPPCSEIITWVISEISLEARPSSISVMTSFLNQGRANNRVLQPRKDHVIYEASNTQ